MESQIVLKTNEGEEVIVPKAFENVSGLIKNITEEFTGEIQLNISKKHLDLMIEYAAYHRYVIESIEKPIKSTKMREVVKDPWDYEFLMKIKKNYDIVEVIMAANYMDVTGLLELLFAYIASRFKGKDIDKIRAKYGITKEFTEEEEQKLLRENPWAPR